MKILFINSCNKVIFGVVLISLDLFVWELNNPGFFFVAVVPLLCTTIAFLFFLVSPVTSSQDGISASTKQRREQIVACQGAVATDDGRCSKIGMNVLRIGGHAVDAAVAASLCLGVVSPASSGIGGGAFMLLREANGKTRAFDMRETAPMKASQVHTNRLT